MTLTEYAHSLRKRWIAILLLAVLGAVAGVALAYVTPDQYRSSGSLLVKSSRGSSTSELTQGSSYVQATIPSYVVLATSDIVLQPVIDELELDTTPVALSKSITASAPLQTAVIEIAAVSRSAQGAQRVADAVLDSLAKQIPRVSPHATNGASSITAITIQHATRPLAPFAPQRRLQTALGALIGLGLGVVYALSRRYIGDHIGAPRDIEEFTSTPVLGQVVETKRNGSLSALILNDPLSPEAESVRTLAANLHFLRVDGGLKSLAITSPNEGDGKSTLALALSLVVAESGKSVILVDGDLRRGTVADMTGLDNGVGLTTVLLGDVAIDDAVEQWGTSGLDVLTSGPIPPNPSQLISSNAMEEFIARSEERYDLVIIDCGPILRISEPIWLSHASDGALLVARWGKTARRKFDRAVTALERAESAILGIAITRTPRRGIGRYEYSSVTQSTSGKKRGMGKPSRKENDASRRGTGSSKEKNLTTELP